MLTRKQSYLQHLDGASAPPASAQLEAEGYVLLKSVFTAAEVEQLKSEINSVFDALPPDGRTRQRSLEDDAEFRYEMFNRSAACQRAVAHHGILDVIEPLLGEDCHIIANTAWKNGAAHASEHGGGVWHIDAGPHVPLPPGTEWPAEIPHPVFAVGVHIYLQDCDIDDGPTGVIPGSHVSGGFPPLDQLWDKDLSWNGQGVVPLLAEAGDVGAFVSDVWHRRMPQGPNDQGRFFLQVHYGRRDVAQRVRTTAEVNHLSDEALARIESRRERRLFGLHSPHFYDG